MIHRDDLIRMAREAGFEVHDRKQQVRVGVDALVGIDSTEKLERFAALVAAHVIARQPPPPMVLNVSDADLSKLKAWLVNAPNMPLVHMPTSDAVREAVLAEREACANVCDCLDAKVDKYPGDCSAAIRARGAA